MAGVFTRQGSQVRTLWCPPYKSISYLLILSILGFRTKLLRKFDFLTDSFRQFADDGL